MVRLPIQQFCITMMKILIFSMFIMFCMVKTLLNFPEYLLPGTPLNNCLRGVENSTKGSSSSSYLFESVFHAFVGWYIYLSIYICMYLYVYDNQMALIFHLLAIYAFFTNSQIFRLFKLYYIYTYTYKLNYIKSVSIYTCIDPYLYICMCVIYAYSYGYTYI